MPEAPRASQAPQERRERITDAEVRQALTRNTAENRPTDAREAERWNAGNNRDYDLLTMAVALLPREGRILQHELEKIRRKSEAPHLVERQKNVQAVIGAYMEGMHRNLKEHFLEPNFSARSQEHAKDVLGKISDIFNEAQRKGLVTVWGGRVCNRFGYAEEWIEKLTAMRSGADLTPRQKAMIQEVERFFQQVIASDPVPAQARRTMRQKRPESAAVREGKAALKMLGILAMAGMALISGLLDLKNKQISPYTLAWLGLTGWSAGFLRGQSAIVRDQLAFVPSQEWEHLCRQLSIRGQDGVDFIDFIQKKHKGKDGAKLRALLKKGQQQKKVDTKEYIKLLVGETPQGPEALMEAKLKTLSPEQLYALCLHLTSVTNARANALIRDFVQNGVNSRSVEPEMAALRKPPSASTPSGTPPSGLLPE